VERKSICFYLRVNKDEYKRQKGNGREEKERAGRENAPVLIFEIRRLYG